MRLSGAPGAPGAPVDAGDRGRSQREAGPSLLVRVISLTGIIPPTHAYPVAVDLDGYLLSVNKRERRVAGDRGRDTQKPGPCGTLDNYFTYSF